MVKHKRTIISCQASVIINERARFNTALLLDYVPYNKKIKIIPGLIMVGLSMVASYFIL